MARARNIKPGFFENEELVELPFATRLLFIGLWTIADREGRLEDRPKRIKMSLFPADNLDIDEALNELQASGFLLRYEVDGNRYIQILAFKKHQNPHKDEKASTIPAYIEHGASTVQAPCNNGGNPADSLIPDSPKEDSPNQPKPAARDGYTSEFEQAWSEYPDRPGVNKKESFKAWNARLKTGVSADDMIDGVIKYAAFVKAMKTDPQYVKQPATFFGPDEHFKSDWTAQARASPKPYESEKDRSRREAAEKLTGRSHDKRNPIIDITPGHTDQVGGVLVLENAGVLRE